MNNYEYRDKYCVIGAGVAGLTAIKNLKTEGIPFDAIETASDVGGIWMSDRPGSPMYKNTHLISPKQVTAFSDFPMPEDYPDFPHHKLVLEYLRSYARHFGLYEHITFNTSVEKVEPIGNLWKVILSNGETRQYRGVIVANGHHSEPKHPNVPGSFNGVIMHSRDYNSPEQLCNKRVLIVGAGQSAIDIVSESAVVAQETFHSTRRSFFCLKKYILGKPTEQFLQELPIILHVPVQTIFKILSSLLPGLQKLEGIDVKKLGIPSGGDREVIYPIIGDKIYQYYTDREIKPKPNVKSLEGDKVLFEDGSLEEIDIIIYATGYQLSFPFLDKKILNWQDKKKSPDLFLYIFHPQFDNLFLIGMVNPLGAHWTVYEDQIRLVIAYLKAKKNKGTSKRAARNLKTAKYFEQIKMTFKHENNYIFNGLKNPQKYPLIVDKAKYTKVLRKWLKSLESV